MRQYIKTAFATLLISYGVFVLAFGIFSFNHSYSYENEAQTQVVPVYWDDAETKRLEYDFSAADKKLKAISERGGKATIALGFKLPDTEGDAECRFPEWYDHSLNQSTKDKYLFQILRSTVNHFQDRAAVAAWQVEQNPSLAAEGCPEYNLNLLNTEIALVEKVDDTNKQIIVDKGTATLSDFRNWLNGFIN